MYFSQRMQQTMCIMHTGDALCFIPSFMPPGPHPFEFVDDAGDRFYLIHNGIEWIRIETRTFVKTFSIKSLFIN